MDEPSTTPASRARARLRRELTDAMHARDRVTAAALRSGLSALDQAEAVPAAGHEATVGIAGETARRELGDDDVRRALRAEVEERRDSAAQLRAVAQDEAAERIDAERRVLEAHLEGEAEPEPDPTG